MKPDAQSPNWRLIVASASLVIALSMGLRQVSGLFLVPVSQDIGIGRETFGLVIAVQNVVWGLAQPVAGLLADRFGPVGSRSPAASPMRRAWGSQRSPRGPRL
jgi:MFS family permease